MRHYSYELNDILDKIPSLPENDPDRFWGRTDDDPEAFPEDDILDLKPVETQSMPVSPASGTPVRKRSLARWELGRQYSIKEEHEAPGRLQHTKEGVFTRRSGDPPSPDSSRTGSIFEGKEGKEVAGTGVMHRLELVRSHSDMTHGWVDLDGARRYEQFGSRERKESSASSVSNTSGSGTKENIRRMNAFWDATPEEIAQALTRMEWEHFIAITVLSSPFLFSYLAY